MKFFFINKMLFKFGPWILWMVITYYLSDLPAESVTISKSDWIERNLKNVLHFIQYLGLYVVTIRAFDIRWNNKSLLLALIWCLCFAVSDEIHQMSTPNRDASLNDWLIDTSGAAVGMILIKCLTKYPSLLKKIFQIELIS